MLSARLARAWLPVCLAILGSSSCAHERHALPPRPPREADPGVTERVLASLADHYHAVSDFKATVLITATVGASGAARVKQYRGIRAFILFRKPAEVRLLGLHQVIPLKLFDLVSNGSEFRLHVPARRQFFAGPVEGGRRSPNRLENLRPGDLLEALVTRPVEGAGERARLEDPAGSANYVLRITRGASPEETRAHRTVWIDRATFQVTRELTVSDTGQTLSDARYTQWQASNGALFPDRLELDRPREECRLTLQTLKIEINQGLSDAEFVLEQPAGTLRIAVGEPGAPAGPLAQP